MNYQIIKVSDAEKWLAVLNAINDTGSINKASEMLGVEFKTVKRRLNAMSEIYNETNLVESFIGGNLRGGTDLTAYGRKILQKLKH